MEAGKTASGERRRVLSGKHDGCESARENNAAVRQEAKGRDSGGVSVLKEQDVEGRPGVWLTETRRIKARSVGGRCKISKWGMSNEEEG